MRWRLESPAPQAAGNPVRWENQIPTSPASPKAPIVGQANSPARGSRSRPAPTWVMESWTAARNATSAPQTDAERAKALPPSDGPGGAVLPPARAASLGVGRAKVVETHMWSAFLRWSAERLRPASRLRGGPSRDIG